MTNQQITNQKIKKQNCKTAKPTKNQMPIQTRLSHKNVTLVPAILAWIVPLVPVCMALATMAKKAMVNAHVTKAMKVTIVKI